jgi:hypothetical protein
MVVTVNEKPVYESTNVAAGVRPTRTWCGST